MATDLVVALVGAGGALAGTAVGTGLTALANERRARAQAKLEDDREKSKAHGDLLRAALVLQADLLKATGRYAIALGNQTPKYWSEHFAMPIESWETERAVIAQHLKPDDWRQISDAFRSMEASETRARTRREKTGKRRPDFGKTELRRAPEAQARVQNAIRILSAICGPPTPVIEAEAIEDDLLAQDPELRNEAEREEAQERVAVETVRELEAPSGTGTD